MDANDFEWGWGVMVVVPRVKGFTLIETLLAVSIFGTIVAAIYMSFSTGMEARSRVEAVSEKLNRARFALDIMADDLLSPGRISPGILEGWDGGFRLALGNAAWREDWAFPETELGAETLEYRLVERPESGQILVRRFLRGEEVLSEVELLGPVSAFQVVYFASDHGGTGAWVDEWDEADGLPFAVKLTLSVPAGGGSSAAPDEGFLAEGDLGARNHTYSEGRNERITEYRRLVSLPPSWLRPPIRSARPGAGEGQ